MKFNVSSQASTHTNADLHRKSSTPDAAATDPDLDLAVVVMSNSTHPINRDTLFDALREIEWQVTTTGPGSRG